ncbi:MAG: hypothetical protein D3923_18615, partial [Candidatus Electrothrix sp. AR3]|nr:hypothetical protein [Candidatus Electrothrix sp. AR3]
MNSVDRTGVVMKYLRRKIYPHLLPCLLSALLLCSTADFALATTYTASPTITSEGDSADWGAQFTMSISISGTQSTYRIGKTNGETFTSAGTMHLKAGTFEGYGTDHDSKPVTADATKVITFTEDFDEYPIYTYPKLIYARYVSDGGYWSWVGPIKIIPELPPSNETDYKADRYTTIAGNSHEGTDFLRLQASIDGADALFMVTRNVSGMDKPTFQLSGTMAIKLDS